mmetsp:Transcript_44789/g.93983  ORF Transcript_44789/g.93983 Transcript_44789/m.93983 type:complete len:99 (+) Transcript_44789:2728-3024(+)
MVRIYKQWSSRDKQPHLYHRMEHYFSNCISAATMPYFCGAKNYACYDVPLMFPTFQQMPLIYYERTLQTYSTLRSGILELKWAISNEIDKGLGGGSHV